MSLAIRKPINQHPNLLADAANEYQSDAGQAAIAAVREIMGKTSAASRYDKLTNQQKAMVLFASKLKPSVYINRPLQSLTVEEQDAVRFCLISLVDLGRAFSGMPLSRAQFLVKPKKPLAKSDTQTKQPQKAVDDELNTITEQAKSIMSELDNDLKH